MLNPQFKAAAYRLAVIEHLTQYLTDQFLSSGDIAPKRQLICEHGLYADHVTPQDPFYEVIDWLRRLAAREHEEMEKALQPRPAIPDIRPASEIQPAQESPSGEEHPTEKASRAARTRKHAPRSRPPRPDGKSDPSDQ